MPRIVGIVQARMTSTRLPGKVARLVLGKPMLARHLERLTRVSGFDELAVATSVDPSDDAVQAIAELSNVRCIRGSLADVLDRYHSAAAALGADVVVRLTADCPLADPTIIDEVINLHTSCGYDYTSNFVDRRFPDGLDAEVMNTNVLEAAWREATDPADREHVTSWIYRQPQRFLIGSLRNPVDQSGLRWTVDEARDLEFVRTVYERLYPFNPEFGTSDILQLLADEPELVNMNQFYTGTDGELA